MAIEEHEITFFQLSHTHVKPVRLWFMNISVRVSCTNIIIMYIYRNVSGHFHNRYILQCATSKNTVYIHNYASVTQPIYTASCPLCVSVIQHCSKTGALSLYSAVHHVFSSQIRKPGNKNAICYLYSSGCVPSPHPSPLLSQAPTRFHLMPQCTGLTSACSQRHCGNTIM